MDQRSSFMTFRFCARVAVGVGLLACAAPVSTQPTPGQAKFGRFGIDLTSMKKDVKPGDDFWTYANGAWDARTDIAPDRSSAGVAVTAVDEAEVNVRGLLDDMEIGRASCRERV